MSPIWLLLGAPALLLPLGILVLIDDDVPVSVVEQAISALPIPGNASDPDAARDSGGSSRVAALGTDTARMPASTSLTLYNNSARAEAARLGQRDDSPKPRAVVDLAAITYALLHPRYLAREDMLIGDYTLMMTTPLGSSLGLSLYREFCTARLDGAVSTKIDLSENSNILVALTEFIPASGQVSFCPQTGT